MGAKRDRKRKKALQETKKIEKRFEQRISTFLSRKEKVTSTIVENIRLFRMLVSRRRKGNVATIHRTNRQKVPSTTRRQTTVFRVYEANLDSRAGDGIQPNRSERWIFSLGTDYQDQPISPSARTSDSELYGGKVRLNARSWPDLETRYLAYLWTWSTCLIEPLERETNGWIKIPQEFYARNVLRISRRSHC